MSIIAQTCCHLSSDQLSAGAFITSLTLFLMWCHFQQFRQCQAGFTDCFQALLLSESLFFQVRAPVNK